MDLVIGCYVIERIAGGRIHRHAVDKQRVDPVIGVRGYRELLVRTSGQRDDARRRDGTVRSRCRGYRIDRYFERRGDRVVVSYIFKIVRIRC